MKYLLSLPALIVLTTSLHAQDKNPVKVFILAGQSNMEGKAKVSLLDYQVQQPANKEFFQPFRKDDKWLEHR